MKKTTQKTNSLIKQAAPAFLASAAVLFLLLIYAPVATYATNVEGFTYDIYDLLKVMIPLYLAALVVFIILLGLTKISYKIVNIIAVAMVGILVALYIQGTFLAGNLPQLDGRNIDWADFDYQRIPSIIVWVGSLVISIAAAVILKGEKFGKIVKYISLFLIVMLLVSAVLITVPGDGLINKDNLPVTDAFMLDYSKDEPNLIVLVMDYAGGAETFDIFRDNPEYEEIFEDFTMYHDNVGSYPNTKFVIPLILTGEWFENQESFFTFRERVYAESPLLNSLDERGYRIGIYENEYLPTSKAASGRFENATVSDTSGFISTEQFIKTQLKFALLKYAPYDLKRFCLITPELILENTLMSDSKGIFDWSNRAFLEKVKTESITESDSPCFRFIHISGAHEPFIYDKDMNVIDIKDGTYEQELMASLKCAEEFVNLLKESGVYDNSAIVIMGDHGYIWDTRFQPLLMIKGIGEQHGFVMSEKPVSHEDLHDAFLRLSEGESAEECIPAREPRKYIFYDYNDEKTMDIREKE